MLVHKAVAACTNGRRLIQLLFLYMPQLDHPNIMKIVEGYESMGNVTTIMELLDGW